MAAKKKDPSTFVLTLLKTHFGAVSIPDLIVATRSFPVTSRVDLQRAIDQIFSTEYDARLYGHTP